METPEAENDAPVQPLLIHQPVEVFSKKDWNDYARESAMIVFSVLVALFLTEIVNYIHDKNETHELLNNIRLEMVNNKKAVQEQYVYQQQVLKNIDSALNHPEFRHKIFSDGELHLQFIAPDGIVYHDLSKVAWQIAQSKAIISRINFSLVEQLTDIYDQQARIDKLEDEIAGVLLRPGARSEANLRETLILMRDNYHGWAFERTPGLIKQYDDTIKAIGD